MPSVPVAPPMRPVARQSMRRAIIRLQTVTTLPVEHATDGGHPTIGETIDDLIRHHTAKGQIPNKLVLDLNPPAEDNPADLQDSFDEAAESF